MVSGGVNDNKTTSCSITPEQIFLDSIVHQRYIVYRKTDYRNDVVCKLYSCKFIEGFIPVEDPQRSDARKIWL